MGFPNLVPQTLYGNNLVSILSWLKPQIPTKYYKAIEVLLKPCCELNIANISFSCLGGGNADITVTLSKPIIFYDTPTIISLSDGARASIGGVIVNSTTITFSNFSTNAAASLWVLDIQVPTSSDGNIGYYLRSPIFTITGPTCK